MAAEFATQPLQPAGPPVTSADLEDLPGPVRRYLERSGVVGRPRPQNMRVVLDANMYRKPGQAPMRARSLQYSFFGRPTRIFLMRARMFGLPVRALHIYRQAAATFTVRVASAVNMVDLSGPEISAAETVTVLNDLCLLAPAALLDPRLTWTDVDDQTARVTFTNAPRWSTPITGYRDVGGMHLLQRGGAVYDRKDGPFMYGDFTMQSIAFDVAGPIPT